MYGLSMFLCGLVVLSHALITTSTHFLVLTALFGILYGSQNVLIAVTPSKVFGREKLPTVFGYILFLGGIGALIGAPIAGKKPFSSLNYIISITEHPLKLVYFTSVCM